MNIVPQNPLLTQIVVNLHDLVNATLIDMTQRKAYNEPAKKIHKFLLTQALEVGPGKFFAEDNITAMTAEVRGDADVRTIADKMAGLMALTVMGYNTEITHFLMEVIKTATSRNKSPSEEDASAFAGRFMPKDVRERLINEENHWIIAVYLLSLTIYLADWKDLFHNEEDLKEAAELEAERRANTMSVTNGQTLKPASLPR